MRTFILFLLLIASAAAAPLYLRCDGEWVEQAKTEPAAISITIDGTYAKVEDLAPVLIYSNDEDVWTFGNPASEVRYGQINRITGQVTIDITEAKHQLSFDGVCRKAEKLF
jgi:hypothetical protein